MAEVSKVFVVHLQLPTLREYVFFLISHLFGIPSFIDLRGNKTRVFDEMSAWELLDTESELDLHKCRLLNVEEKPFKRITKRLNTVTSLAASTDSLGSAQNGESRAAEASKPKLNALKEDLTLDFAAFDSTITRLQFLLHANARERERYAADQERILSECQAVRVSNTQLREQLEEARATLAQRKKLDELAEKITSNRLLRPREDQITNLAKLEEECKELERESETYSETWRERREQFNRIMEEGMLLRRQIRDEKEEVDRREGMNEGGEDDAEVERGGQTPKNDASDDATPRPDGDSQAKVDGEAGTPRPDTSHEDPTASGETTGPDTLRPLPGGLGSLSRGGSQAPSRGASPLPQQDNDKTEPGEDVEMEDPEGQKMQEEGETPQVTVEAPENNEEKMEVDN